MELRFHSNFPANTYAPFFLKYIFYVNDSRITLLEFNPGCNTIKYGTNLSMSLCFSALDYKNQILHLSNPTECTRTFQCVFEMHESESNDAEHYTLSISVIKTSVTVCMRCCKQLMRTHVWHERQDFTFSKRQTVDKTVCRNYNMFQHVITCWSW